MKNRKVEFYIALIASLLGTLGWLVLTVITCLLLSKVTEAQAFGFMVLFVFIFLTIFNLPLLIVNWVGTFKLHLHPRGWGIYFLLSGLAAINLFSMTAGILLLVRYPRTSI